MSLDTDISVVYPYFGMEVNFYPTETLQKLYFEPVNEQSIKMRTPEDYLKPTEVMGRQGYLFTIHQRGDLFINSVRVQKEYDPILEEDFFLVEMPPLPLKLPQTQQTPKYELKHYSHVWETLPELNAIFLASKEKDPFIRERKLRKLDQIINDVTRWRRE